MHTLQMVSLTMQEYKGALQKEKGGDWDIGELKNFW